MAQDGDKMKMGVSRSNTYIWTVFVALFVLTHILFNRTASVMRVNERLQKELSEINATKKEREQKPKTAETPKRQLKKDARPIPGKNDMQKLVNWLKTTSLKPFIL